MALARSDPNLIWTRVKLRGCSDRTVYEVKFKDEPERTVDDWFKYYFTERFLIVNAPLLERDFTNFCLDMNLHWSYDKVRRDHMKPHEIMALAWKHFGVVEVFSTCGRSRYLHRKIFGASLKPSHIKYRPT